MALSQISEDPLSCPDLTQSLGGGGCGKRGSGSCTCLFPFQLNLCFKTQAFYEHLPGPGSPSFLTAVPFYLPLFASPLVLGTIWKSRIPYFPTLYTSHDALHIAGMPYICPTQTQLNKFSLSPKNYPVLSRGAETDPALGLLELQDLIRRRGDNNQMKTFPQHQHFSG